MAVVPSLNRESAASSARIRRLLSALFLALLTTLLAACGGGTRAAVSAGKVKAISVGGRHACALISDRHIMCWGDGSSGQLGDGLLSDSSVPVRVKGISNAVQVSAGGWYTCALLKDGIVKCWGWHGEGERGDGTTKESALPVAVKGIAGATQISSGREHTCAVLLNGSAFCWGTNVEGELGDGSRKHGHRDDNGDFSPVPVKVSGIKNAKEISAGDFGTCARLANGSLECWGDTLGDGTMNESTTPVEVK